MAQRFLIRAAFGAAPPRLTAALQASLDTWPGRPVTAAAVDDVVLRYLGAFGPTPTAAG
ncbi:MAG: hypothetical protein ACRDTT_31625 [Pseudonocardiaceae bacterium]